MGKLLTTEQVKCYRDNGFLYPIKIFSKKETLFYKTNLEKYEKKMKSIISGVMRHKAHLYFRWIDEIVRNEKLLNAVEDILGKNILCWSSDFFIKEAKDESYVSWHQDAKYWGLYPYEIITAWLALSEASVNKGPMEVIPKSHKWKVLNHIETKEEKNLLTRGQDIKKDLSNEKIIKMPLRAGEISLHHGKLAHRSGFNNSSSRRIGVAIRYINTKVRQKNGYDSATLVRGSDKYKNFYQETSALYSTEAKAKINHMRAVEVFKRNLSSLE